MGEPRRRAFLGQAFTAGLRWLFDVSNHATRVIALVGLLVGVSLAGVLATPLAVLALVAVLGVAFAEGAFITWREAVTALADSAHGRDDRTASLLVSILNVMMELGYIETRVEQGEVDGGLPNVEWVRHKDRIAEERGDIFATCHLAYQEADWLVRHAESLMGQDEEELEQILVTALQPIREAQEELGEWENDILKAEAASPGDPVTGG